MRRNKPVERYYPIHGERRVNDTPFGSSVLRNPMRRNCADTRTTGGRMRSEGRNYEYTDKVNGPRMLSEEPVSHKTLANPCDATHLGLTDFYSGIRSRPFAVQDTEYAISEWPVNKRSGEASSTPTEYVSRKRRPPDSSIIPPHSAFYRYLPRRSHDVGIRARVGGGLVTATSHLSVSTPSYCSTGEHCDPLMEIQSSILRPGGRFISNEGGSSSTPPAHIRPSAATRNVCSQEYEQNEYGRDTGSAWVSPPRLPSPLSPERLPTAYTNTRRQYNGHLKVPCHPSVRLARRNTNRTSHFTGSSPRVPITIPVAASPHSYASNGPVRERNTDQRLQRSTSRTKEEESPPHSVQHCAYSPTDVGPADMDANAKSRGVADDGNSLSQSNSVPYKSGDTFALRMWIDYLTRKARRLEEENEKLMLRRWCPPSSTGREVGSHSTEKTHAPLCHSKPSFPVIQSFEALQNGKCSRERSPPLACPSSLSLSTPHTKGISIHQSQQPKESIMRSDIAASKEREDNHADATSLMWTKESLPASSGAASASGDIYLKQFARPQPVSSMMPEGDCPHAKRVQHVGHDERLQPSLNPLLLHYQHPVAVTDVSVTGATHSGMRSGACQRFRSGEPLLQHDSFGAWGADGRELCGRRGALAALSADRTSLNGTRDSTKPLVGNRFDKQVQTTETLPEPDDFADPEATGNIIGMPQKARKSIVELHTSRHYTTETIRRLQAYCSVLESDRQQLQSQILNDLVWESRNVTPRTGRCSSVAPGENGLSEEEDHCSIGKQWHSFAPIPRECSLRTASYADLSVNTSPRRKQYFLSPYTSPEVDAVLHDIESSPAVDTCIVVRNDGQGTVTRQVVEEALLPPAPSVLQTTPIKVSGVGRCDSTFIGRAPRMSVAGPHRPSTVSVTSSASRLAADLSHPVSAVGEFQQTYSNSEREADILAGREPPADPPILESASRVSTMTPFTDSLPREGREVTDVPAQRDITSLCTGADHNECREMTTTKYDSVRVISPRARHWGVVDGRHCDLKRGGAILSSKWNSSDTATKRCGRHQNDEGNVDSERPRMYLWAAGRNSTCSGSTRERSHASAGVFTPDKHVERMPTKLSSSKTEWARSSPTGILTAPRSAQHAGVGRHERPADSQLTSDDVFGGSASKEPNASYGAQGTPLVATEIDRSHCYKDGVSISPRTTLLGKGTVRFGLPCVSASATQGTREWRSSMTSCTVNPHGNVYL